MHLAEPMAALGEMLRILRPGGLLICVEPNNLWNYIPFTSTTGTEPTEKLVQEFEFWLRCHRGRIALGEGDHAIGDLLPGYFAQLDLAAISVYQSDRAAALYPPYDTPAQQAMIGDERKAKDLTMGPWNRAEVLRLFLAGGGSEEIFDAIYAELEQHYEREQVAIAAKIFHAGRGSIQYLVSGRKRE
jgi:SAM-dependent methyltransferase